MPSMVLPEFKATVDQVTSGDDLILFVELPVDDLYKKVRVRLQGVDTPDAYQKGKDTKAGKVRESVRNIIRNNPCSIIVHSQGRGGWIVTLTVHTSNGDININNFLQQQGYIFPRDNRNDRKETKTD